jgi:hypothetical protein
LKHVTGVCGQDVFKRVTQKGIPQNLPPTLEAASQTPPQGLVLHRHMVEACNNFLGPPQEEEEQIPVEKRGHVEPVVVEPQQQNGVSFYKQPTNREEYLQWLQWLQTDDVINRLFY